MKKRPVTSVESDALLRLKLRGAESPLLDARLRFMEVEGTARYVRMMRDLPCAMCGHAQGMHRPGVEPAYEGDIRCDGYSPRVYPNFLPTQASGRWSTTNPPMTNFPPDCINPECSLTGKEHAYGTPQCWSARDIVGPDPGWWYLHYDLDSIEAKWAAADAGDYDDLEAFAKRYDVHTIRTCRALGRPLPPLLTKALHTDPSCEDWRNSWDPPWSGEEDRRRHVFKTVGYATLFCINPKGVLQAKGVEKLGLSPNELVRFATIYLKSKPTLMARKRRVWDECAKTGVSYSWFGRRRRLYGDWNTRAKEGWSHRISATVTDYQNQCLIKIINQFPECHLVLNSHDGLTLAFPDSMETSGVVDFSRQVVEKVVTSPTGHDVPVTASWERINADLTRVRVQ